MNALYAETKTQFVKKGAAGGSFLNTLVNKLSFKMHLPGHSFTGPGTKLKFKLTIPVTYKITDCNEEEIQGPFYEQELQKTKQDMLRIERIIRQ